MYFYSLADVRWHHVHFFWLFKTTVQRKDCGFIKADHLTSCFLTLARIMSMNLMLPAWLTALFVVKLHFFAVWTVSNATWWVGKAEAIYGKDETTEKCCSIFSLLLYFERLREPDDVQVELCAAAVILTSQTQSNKWCSDLPHLVFTVTIISLVTIHSVLFAWMFIKSVEQQQTVTPGLCGDFRLL